MKKNNFKFLIILSIYLIYGCSNTDDKLKKYIESHCSFEQSEICYIDLKDALNIDYDKMFLFGEGIRSDEISNIIGLTYSKDKFVPDSKYRIIFVKNNKVVYDDDYYQYQTDFVLLNPIKEVYPLTTCYLCTDSIFYVTKRENEGGRYPYIYFLKPVSEVGIVYQIGS